MLSLDEGASHIPIHHNTPVCVCFCISPRLFISVIHFLHPHFSDAPPRHQGLPAVVLRPPRDWTFTPFWLPTWSEHTENLSRSLGHLIIFIQVSKVHNYRLFRISLSDDHARQTPEAELITGSHHTLIIQCLRGRNIIYSRILPAANALTVSQINWRLNVAL